MKKITILIILLSYSIAFSAEKISRKIASGADPKTLLADVEQDKELLMQAIEAINNDLVFQRRVSNGLEILGVYDTGSRFRCICGNFLVKLKDHGETTIEFVKLKQGKIEKL